MTQTPVFLSFRSLSFHSGGLRRSAALAILPLLLASCGSSTSTASNTPAPSNTTVTSSPSASSATGSASSSAAKKTSTPCLEPDEAAKAETLKQQEAISADRGTALPSYVSARHVVRNQANFPTRAEAESAGAECLALYEKNKADHTYAAAWVRAIDDNNVASGKVASGPRADIQSADPYKASNYVDIREGKEYFPTRQELLAANYPENYIVAFELWAQQAPADVKQKSDANRAAAQDTRWSEVAALPSPDNPV